MKTNYHNTTLYSVCMFFIFVACLLMKLFLDEANANTIHEIASIISLINLIIIVLKHRNAPNGATTVIILWFVSCFVFLLSQDVLLAFGYEPEMSTVPLLRMVSIFELANAVLFSNMFIIMMDVGVTHELKKQSRNRYEYDTVIDSEMENDLLRTNYATKFCFAVFLLPAIYYLFNLITLASSMGYSASFDESFSTSFITRLCRYALYGFEFSIFGLYISAKSKREEVFSIVIAGVLILCYFAIGERTFPISIGLVFINEVIRKRQRISKATIPAVIALAIGVLFLVSIIQQIRSNGIITFSALFNSSKDQDVFAYVLDSLAILGFSGACLPLTMRFVPGNTFFRFGTTYLLGMTTFMPDFLNLFGDNSLGRYSLSRWLQHSLNLSWGPGYSITAEAYINFGWIGILMGIVFGIVITKIAMIDRNNYYKKVISAAALFCIITLPRRYFGSFIGDFVIGIAPFIIVYKFISKGKHR